LDFDIQLEPSAGTGVFLIQMDPTKRIGIDIDPRLPDILNHDFLKWTPPQSSKNNNHWESPIWKKFIICIEIL